MTTENHESFFDRVRPHFAPSVVRKIELAYILAKYSHRAQVRREVDEHGDPLRYFEHVRRATLIGLDEARVVRADTVIASLLHDTLEDTRLSAEMIEDCFGAEVCSIVRVLSKVPKEGYLDRFAACADWRPFFVKACDRLDNLRSLDGEAREFQIKQLTETSEKYFPLLDRMVLLSPFEHGDRLKYLAHEVRRATTRRRDALGL